MFWAGTFDGDSYNSSGTSTTRKTSAYDPGVEEHPHPSTTEYTLMDRDTLMTEILQEPDNW